VALFSACAGLIYGAWVDGTALGWLALGMAAFVILLAGALTWLQRRRRQAVQPS
jgi:uncharacterized iron-regulated membrane protein